MYIRESVLGKATVVEQELLEDRSHVQQLAQAAIQELQTVLTELRSQAGRLVANEHVDRQEQVADDLAQSTFSFVYHVERLIEALHRRPWSLWRPSHEVQSAVAFPNDFYSKHVPMSVAMHAQAALSSRWAVWEMMRLLVEAPEDGAMYVMHEVVLLRRLPNTSHIPLPQDTHALMAWRYGGSVNQLMPFADVARALLHEWQLMSPAPEGLNSAAGASCNPPPAIDSTPPRSHEQSILEDRSLSSEQVTRVLSVLANLESAPDLIPSTQLGALGVSGATVRSDANKHKSKNPWPSGRRPGDPQLYRKAYVREFLLTRWKPGASKKRRV